MANVRRRIEPLEPTDTAGSQSPTTTTLQALLYELPTHQQISVFGAHQQYFQGLIADRIKRLLIPPSELIHLPEDVLNKLLNYLATQQIEIKEIDKETLSLPYLLVRAGKISVLRSLKGMRVDWHGRDQFGNTPAHIAVKKSAVDIMALLVDAGANFELSNRKGESAADWAAKKEDLPFHYSVKGFQALSEKIDALAQHGKSIKVKKESDQIATLVSSLRAMLTVQRRSQIKDEKGIKKFKMDFSKALHSMDKSVVVNRSFFRILIANILLALTMIGSLYVVAQPLYSKLMTGKMTFFAQEMSLGYYFEVPRVIDEMKSSRRLMTA